MRERECHRKRGIARDSFVDLYKPEMIITDVVTESCFHPSTLGPTNWLQYSDLAATPALSPPPPRSDVTEHLSQSEQELGSD